MKIKKSKGSILDATIVESVCRPKTVVKIEDVAEDRKEDELTSEKIQSHSIEYSKDRDARWFKKGKKYFVGYKAFVKTDSDEGFIKQVHMTPANFSETKELAKIIKSEYKKTRLFADTKQS